MDTLKIAGSNQPDMPWEDRPAGSKEVMCAFDVEFDLQLGGRSLQKRKI